MATTPRWGLRYPVGTDAPDVPLWMNRLATDLDGVAMDDQGLLADRPESSLSVPGKRGRYYFATDDTTASANGTLYRDYGTGWEMVGAAPAVVAPVGTMVDYAASGDPVDPSWLLADGREISRTTYADLFALIGTTHGTGNGSSTFNIPDARGRVAVAPDNMGTAKGDAARLTANDALGSSGGEEKHTLSTAEIPAHSHGLSIYYYPGTGLGHAPATGDNQVGTAYSANTGNAGGGGAHNNMQPFVVVNKIIRVL